MFYFTFISLTCWYEQVTEYESAEWSDNQDLQWVGYDEVQADGLEPDEDEIWSDSWRFDGSKQAHQRYHCADGEGLDAEDDEDRAVSWFGYAEREIFGCFAGDEECAEESDEPFQRKRMQCVTECSRLKSTGVDSDVINAHDKDYTAGCDKGENKFLKFCFWHS